jgi:hypothetical protein
VGQDSLHLQPHQYWLRQAAVAAALVITPSVQAVAVAVAAVIAQTLLYLFQEVLP